MLSPKKISSSPSSSQPHSQSQNANNTNFVKGTISIFNYKNYIIIGLFLIVGLIIFYLYKKLKNVENKLESIDSSIDKKINTIDQSIQTQQQLMSQKLNLFEALGAQQKLFINTKIDELTNTVQSHINFIKNEQQRYYNTSRHQSQQQSQSQQQQSQQSPQQQSQQSPQQQQSQQSQQQSQPQSPQQQSPQKQQSQQSQPQSPLQSHQQESHQPQQYQEFDLSHHFNKKDFDLTDLFNNSRIQPQVILEVSSFPVNIVNNKNTSSAYIEEEDEDKEDLDKELKSELEELKNMENNE
jgi:hypothetical protein